MNIIKRLPNVHGWLETKLPKEAMDHLWDCINTARGERHNHLLAGHIEKSFRIGDKGDWFWRNVVSQLVNEYGNQFDHSHANISVKSKHLNPYLDTLWVNYSNQHEFNPTHDHDGLYSFVVWMKIPTYHDEQNALDNAKDVKRSLNSTFQFSYTNSLGDIMSATYAMNPDKEGMMLFFPARLNHCVNPFYQCDEQRISIAGNVCLRDMRVTP